MKISLVFFCDCFSSPHLIEVRERIRINGSPLSKEDFSHYFWQSYNRLEETKVIEKEIILLKCNFILKCSFSVSPCSFSAHS